MKAVHIISGISREGGGPSRSSQALVAALNRAGCDTWLLSCQGGDVAWVEGVSHFAAPEKNERLTDFFHRIFADVKPDIVHLHGIWNWQIHLAARTARQMRIPYVIAPRGMLEPWSLSQKKWKKRLALALYQRNDLKKAIALHATAKSEAEQFRKLGLTNSIIVSPNGVSLPKESKSQVEDGQRRSEAARRVLFVSRMHPKKGLLELVEAWGCVKPMNWVCELVYTMNTDEEWAYEARVKAKVKEFGIDDQFVFTGPLNDDAKWAAYARANAFVLPTYSENFGIVVVEALWAGLPVITSKGTPWEELVARHCGWWVENDPETLARTLREMMALSDDERREMGARGRKLVEEKYQWPAIGRQMAEEYRKLIGRGEKGGRGEGLR